MKFLTNDKRTREHLKSWSGRDALMIASHFFWYTGSGLQKSHQGLLQSLLGQVLSFDSELISVLCPHRVSEMNIGPGWTREELTQSLLNIGKAAGKKVCIFIDGLDEYHPAVDHMQLIATVRALSSVTNINICVSSRPWNDFIEAFRDDCEQIRLEDLTRTDIALFVADELQAIAKIHPCTFDPTEIWKLCLEVTNRAKSVFLWVYFVLSALKNDERPNQALNSSISVLKTFAMSSKSIFDV